MAVGYAADARVNGIGAVCVTYSVGGLSVLNAVAGAYPEKSPLVVVSGSPGLDERKRSPLLHHLVRDFRTQLRTYKNVTMAAEALEDPVAVPMQIDDAIDLCLRHKRPVYFEIPRDMVHVPCAAPQPIKNRLDTTDRQALAEAVDDTAARFHKS